MQDFKAKFTMIPLIDLIFYVESAIIISMFGEHCSFGSVKLGRKRKISQMTFLLRSTI